MEKEKNLAPALQDQNPTPTPLNPPQQRRRLGKAPLSSALRHRRKAMYAAAAARSILRSPSLRTSASAVRSAAAGLKPRPARSPFGIPAQKPMSHRIFRSPMEMSSCVESMLPYHTVTASALLTSMLSNSRRASGWTPEDCNDDL